MIRSIFILVLILVLQNGQFKAQDIHFSQFTETPLLINPANTGFFDGYYRANLNYRNQWVSAGSPYKTMNASFDAEIGMKKDKNAYLGVGAYVFQDRAGDANWGLFNANAFANGIVKVGEKSHLALGLGGGYAQSSANFSKLSFGNQYDGKDFNSALPNQETMVFRNYNYFDLASGLCFDYGHTNNAFEHNNLFGFRVGLAAYHINRPLLKYRNNSKQHLEPRFTGSFNGRIDLKGSKLSVLPNILYMMQGKASELNVGTQLRIRFNDQTKITGYIHETSLYLGMYYRVSDAIIPQVMFEMYGFTFGFSYDYNVSAYKAASRGVGGFEISIRWVKLRDGLYKQKREIGSSKP